MMINQPPPPPAYSMPMPQPIGFEQPPPPPLNAGMHQIPTSNYVYPSGAPYATEPLVQQQARIAALNATPRPYSSGWRGYSYGDRKVAMVIIGVVGLIFVIVFLVLFFTVFNKANSDFEDAKKRQEEFHNKYFSNW